MHREVHEKGDYNFWSEQSVWASGANLGMGSKKKIKISFPDTGKAHVRPQMDCTFVGWSCYTLPGLTIEQCVIFTPTSEGFPMMSM